MPNGVTDAALAKEAADKKGELDAAMGRKSEYHSGGPQGTAPAASAPATPVAQSADTAQHFTGMVNGLRHLFGIKDGAEPSPNGGMSREAGALQAVNQGVSDANDAAAKRP